MTTITTEEAGTSQINSILFNTLNSSLEMSVKRLVQSFLPNTHIP